MKKIITVVLIAVIPAILIFGGLYITSELQMNRLITEAVDNMEQSRYKGIASTCFKKDKSEYECCLASVKAMADLGANIAPQHGCVGMPTDQLRCLGSLEWCVPSQTMMDPGMDDGADKKTCTVDADCVPDSCCHAHDVVNKDFAPECGDMMCTMSCETMLDCGRGTPVCNNGMCDIKAAS